VTEYDASLADALGRAAHVLTGRPDDYDALMNRIADARIVLLGDPSHGTGEVYEQRARITRRLIEQHGFNAVAVDGDWPESYRVNRWLYGRSRDPNADAALLDFRRFPSWVWRNDQVASFVTWLRSHNASIADLRRRVGFYGLDLYSLNASIESVLAYLDRVEPAAASEARRRYAGLKGGADEESPEPLDVSSTCEDHVAVLLTGRRLKREEFLRRDGLVALDEFFATELNAQLLGDADKHYRALLHGRSLVPTLHAAHLADTLDALLAHLEWRSGRARVVVWAHNTQVGDRSVVTRGALGGTTLGGLLRERHPDDAVLVGFTTYTGTVTAAAAWGGPEASIPLPPAHGDSWELALHQTGAALLYLDLKEAGAPFHELRPQRAIGEVYQSDSDRHYFQVALAKQFDAVIHCDRASAVTPLDVTVTAPGSEPRTPE